MKGNKQRSVLMLLAIVMLAAITMMAGCSGSNGATGATGAKGPKGDPGPVTLTNESCMVCHTTGAVEDIGVIHAASTNSNLNITISSVSSNATGSPVVNFHIDSVKSDGTGTAPLTTLVLKNYPSIKIGNLITKGTTTWDTDYWEMWVAETPGQVAHPACAAGQSLDSTSNTCYSNLTTITSLGSLATPATGALTNLGSGDYSYTFTTGFGQAWPGYNNADYLPTQTMRVAIELSSPATGFNKAHPGIYDMTFASDPAAGNVTATGIPSVRQFATIQACQQCHGPLMDGAAHANSRNDLRECDFCHSALYGSLPKHAPGFMADDAADLPVFIHKIHGNTWRDTDDISSAVTGSVTYPEPIQKCDVCHSDPSGSAPGNLSELTNWKTHPTARVCTSCHTGNQLQADQRSMIHDQSVSGVPSGVKTDANCVGCHGSAGDPNDAADIVTAHDTTPAGNDVPEYNVTINISDPANNATETGNGFLGYFVSGETLTVDVTLAVNPAYKGTAPTPVPAAYTTAQDAAYNSGNGLHVASLYIYGPRAFALPLTGTQANSLFGKGNATGFHFSMAIPSGLTAGTYMVRARIADYSYDRNNPTGGGTHAYQIESVALKTFQIGANVPSKSGINGYPAHAALEKKVDGAAPCISCHGSTVMHQNDHAAIFDTDHCTACHDQSGGFAAYIGNRVHAVHAASANGDMVAGRDWSDITFPQTIATTNCSICHTVGSTSGSYLVNVYETPCLGCHGDDPAALAHMLQNGGKFQ
jgi:hypothetical protein